MNRATNQVPLKTPSDLPATRPMMMPMVTGSRKAVASPSDVMFTPAKNANNGTASPAE